MRGNEDEDQIDEEGRVCVAAARKSKPRRRVYAVKEILFQTPTLSKLFLTYIRIVFYKVLKITLNIHSLSSNFLSLC